MGQPATKKQKIVLFSVFTVLIAVVFLAADPLGLFSQKPSSVSAPMAESPLSEAPHVQANTPLDSGEPMVANDVNMTVVPSSQFGDGKVGGMTSQTLGASEKDLDEVFASFSGKAEKATLSGQKTTPMAQSPVGAIPPPFMLGQRNVLPRGGNMNVPEGAAIMYQPPMANGTQSRQNNGRYVRFCENGKCGFITDHGFVAE